MFKAKESYAFLNSEKESEENGYLDDQRVSFGSLSSDRRIALFYYMEEVDNIKSEYKQKEFDIEWKYKSKIKGLENENSRLNKIIWKCQ